MRQNKTSRRCPLPIAHNIIVRYDYDSNRWVHSAGIVVTARELTVLEAMAKANGTPAQIAQGAGCSVDTFYAVKCRLKKYLGTDSDHAILKLALDLYGTNEITRKLTHG